MTAYPTVATRTLLLFVSGLISHTLVLLSAHAQSPPANDGKLRILLARTRMMLSTRVVMVWRPCGPSKGIMSSSSQ